METRRLLEDLQGYIDIDSAEPIEQDLSDEEIVQAMLCEADMSDEVGEDEEEGEEELDPPPPSLRDAQQAMSSISSTVVFLLYSS